MWIMKKNINIYDKINCNEMKNFLKNNFSLSEKNSQNLIQYLSENQGQILLQHFIYPLKNLNYELKVIDPEKLFDKPSLQQCLKMIDFDDSGIIIRASINSFFYECIKQNISK